MDERDDIPKSMAGTLLLAHPAMVDENFRRTAIVLSVHGKDGAMGVIFNRPLNRRVGDLNAEFAASSLADVPLYTGGPVQTKQLILVAWQPDPVNGGFKLHFGIDVEKAEELLADPDVNVRAFLGYSGWSRGQLENEIRHNTWVIAPVDGALAGGYDGVEMWREVLGGLSPEWKILSGEPDDPEAN